MKKILKYLCLFILIGEIANANMNIIQCGGYVGYDEKYIYLNSFIADSKKHNARKKDRCV